MIAIASVAILELGTRQSPRVREREIGSQSLRERETERVGSTCRRCEREKLREVIHRVRDERQRKMRKRQESWIDRLEMKEIERVGSTNQK